MKIIITFIIIGLFAFIGGKHPSARGIPTAGYIFLGMCLGPWGLGLFSMEHLLELQPLAMFGLAWVGIIIGMQGDLSLWNRAGFRVVQLSLLLGLGAGTAAALPTFAGLVFLGHSPVFALAGALILGAGAAASTRPRNGKGPIHQLAKACAGLDDLMALLLSILPFAMVSLTGTIYSPGDVFLHMGIAICLGLPFGVAFALLVGPRAKLDERLAVAIGVLALIAGNSAYLGAAPFVVAGFSGIILVNTKIGPKEKVYEVLVDAERPIGLCLMIFAGALVGEVNADGLLLGLFWAGARLLGRKLSVKLLKAPPGLDRHLVAISPILMVVTTGFVLLAPSALGPLLLQTAVVGWFATEAWLLLSSRWNLWKGKLA